MGTGKVFTWAPEGTAKANQPESFSWAKSFLNQLLHLLLPSAV
jgi:hypothetical protein